VQNLLSSAFLPKTIWMKILPVTLYGCETLTIREKPRLTLSKNRVQMEVFGSKEEQVVRE